jgi:hypothetical protein
VREHKLGGKANLRIVAQASPDIVASLVGADVGAPSSDFRLSHLVAAKHGGSVRIDLIPLPPVRSANLVSQLEQLLAHGLGQQQPAPAADEHRGADIDVVVFSLLPDLVPLVLTDREGNAGVDSFQTWGKYGPDQLTWTVEHTPPPTGESVWEWKERVTQLIRFVKEQLTSHVIIYNCSALYPGEYIHNYKNISDTITERIKRYNLSVIELSIAEGISIIDVERIVAQAGDRFLVDCLRYTNEAYAAIGTEFLRVLDDIGFFEARPLTMQLGQQRA